MAIAKMKLVNILADKKHLNEVILRFSELDNFHPEPATKIAESVHGLKTLQEENPYTELTNHFHEVCMEMGLNLTPAYVRDLNFDSAKVQEYIQGVYEKFKSIQTVQNEIETVIRENKDALIQVKNLKKLDMSLDDVFSLKYIKVRFGRLPLDSVEKLQYYTNKPFVFHAFEKDHNYSWCAYFTTTQYEGEVDNMFSSLYFERIRIPDFVHGTPLLAEENLKEEIENDGKQLEHIETVRNQLLAQCKEPFEKIAGELQLLNKMFDAKKYVVDLGERFSITGFVMKDDVEDVKKAFAFEKEVEIEVRPAHSDKRLTPPTKLKNRWFPRPFSMFVEMYGLPNYDDIDPTPFVALTYTLLFGIMFGDLGQGLVLALVGWFAAKKGMKLGEIGIRIGISSAFFGILFGSVFGNEELLTPMYQNLFGLEDKPIHVMGNDFIMPLLISAISIGAVLIICSMGIHLYIKIKQKDYANLIFSENGIAGFVFYLALVGGIALQIGFGVPVFQPWYIIGFIIIPLIMIFMKEAMIHKFAGKPMFPEGFGGYVTLTIFELVEVCLSYATNTISFLRVGGFVLSHAGMMLVVELLTSMAGAGGIIVMIFGNAFVMCLEGMIVGIQVLRLEFYEMFSRYFTANGIRFETLKEK